MKPNNPVHHGRQTASVALLATEREKGLPRPGNRLANTYYHAIRKAKSDKWIEFLQGAKGKDIFQVLRYTRPRKERTDACDLPGQPHSHHV